MPTALRCEFRDFLNFQCPNTAEFDGTNWPTGWLRYFLLHEVVRDFCPQCRIDVLNAVARNGHKLEPVPTHAGWFKLVKS